MTRKTGYNVDSQNDGKSLGRCTVADIETYLFSPPNNSPWGKVQYCDTLCPGVFMITTPGHGGTMVSKDMVAVLSPAARKCGRKDGDWLCFEEDTEENIVFRELLDKKLWAIPERIKNKAAYEENINQCIQKYHPDYWRARQCGVETSQTRQTSIPKLNAEL